MKKIVSIILVVVLALSLGTVALAAPKEDKGNANSDKTTTVTTTEVIGTEIITVTVTVPLDKISTEDLINTGNSNTQSVWYAEDDNGEYEITIAANPKGGNGTGWYVNPSVPDDGAEYTYSVSVTYWHGNSGNQEVGKDVIVGSADGIDYVEELLSNFLGVDAVEVSYEKEIEVDIYGDVTTTITRENNGRAHGNNANFGEPTGNWKDTEEAQDDGYAHPGGKDGEGNEKNNGKVK